MSEDSWKADTSAGLLFMETWKFITTTHRLILFFSRSLQTSENNTYNLYHPLNLK